MKIVLACDHAGFEMKEMLKDWLTKEHNNIDDVGTYSNDSVDYPDFAHVLAEGVAKGKYDLGILLCGSGNGVCMTANKHEGVRAALAWNAEVACLARKHNNANILCLPSRFITEENAKEIVQGFLDSEFEGGRHQKRVEKIQANSNNSK
jgi:ribose 5-phosphate isomerase B